MLNVQFETRGEKRFNNALCSCFPVTNPILRTIHMKDNTERKYSQLRVESNNYTEELFGKKIEEAKVISLINCRVVGTAGAEGACATPITFSRVNVPFFLFLGPPQTSFNGFTAPPTVLPYFHFVKIINALYGLCPSKMTRICCALYEIIQKKCLLKPL